MLIAGVVVLFTGFMLMISYPINKKKNSHCTEQTEGTLTNIIGRFNSKQKLKDKHVYTYYVDDVEYQLATLDHSLDVNNIGDRCTIWYNPSKPEEAQAFHGSDKYLKTLRNIGLVLFLLGFILTCYGCVQQIQP